MKKYSGNPEIILAIAADWVKQFWKEFFFTSSPASIALAIM